MQRWFTPSDAAIDEEFCGFAYLGGWMTDDVSDESTLLRCRHVLEERNLADQLLATVDLLQSDKGSMLRSGRATLTSAPSSTKNVIGERDPEMK